jgi:phage terminase large subunit
MSNRQIKINQTYQQLFDSNGDLRSDVRYFEIYGGRRSAKSFSVVQAICIQIMREPGHFVVAIRKVAATLKDSIFAEYVDFSKRHGVPFRENKTDKEISLPNGSRIRCFGLDDADKLKSLKGATIIHFEEANECSEDDFDTVDAGLSPNNYPARIFLTHNPMPQIVGSMHWIQRRFLQIEHKLSVATINAEANALVLRTWYKDNAYCPAATIKVLEGYKKTNPEKYKLWALGEFTKLEGVVFQKWDIVDSVPDGIIQSSIGVGLDFGFSNDPCAAVRLWVSGREIWTKQLLYKTDLHNDALYRELVDAGVGQFETVTADSARPDIISDLYRMGLNGIAGVKKRANYKEDVATRLQSYTIHIVQGSTDLAREISTYCWARDKNGKQLPKLQDGDDHAIDAIIMRMHEYTGAASMLDVPW